MINRKIPVMNAAGKIIGDALAGNGWGAATKLLGTSAALAFRTIDGKRVDVWVPAQKR